MSQSATPTLTLLKPFPTPALLLSIQKYKCKSATPLPTHTPTITLPNTSLPPTLLLPLQKHKCESAPPTYTPTLTLIKPPTPTVVDSKTQVRISNRRLVAGCRFEKFYCPSARHIYSQKVLVISRKQWLRPDMSEKLFTGTFKQKRNENKTPLIMV